MTGTESPNINDKVISTPKVKYYSIFIQVEKNDQRFMIMVNFFSYSYSLKQQQVQHHCQGLLYSQPHSWLDIWSQDFW